MDPENCSYQRDSPHANAVEIPDLFQAGILLSAVERDIQMLEQVQRNFILKITGMEQLSYWEQLHALSMYSLERRRERYLIIYTWRIIEGQLPNIGEPNKGGITLTCNLSCVYISCHV